MAQAVDYSNLEVGQSPHTPKEAYSTLQVQKSKEEYSTLQVQRPKEKYSSLPQVNAPDLSAWDTKKELSRPYDPYDASAPEKVGEYADPDPPFSSKRNRTICGLRRRIFWITIALSVLVIAAIIGGAVGGTVSKHARKHVHSTSSTLLANTSDVPSASQLLNSTSLSAVAWNDTTQTLQQRLYIQASDSNIWELSWNSAVQRWFTSSKAIAKAKPGSPLAAAVAYKGRTNVSRGELTKPLGRPKLTRTLQQLNLYFINDGGQLMQMNTTDYQTWDTNPVRTSTGTIAKPANDSSLAATWYKYTVCADCSYNAFVAYQDSDNGTFRVVNSSTSGDVQHVAIPGHPVSGSACTFDLEWRSTTRANIRLGYQMGSGQIASAAWNGMFASLPARVKRKRFNILIHE